MASDSRRPRWLAPAVIRLVGAWVLVGALAKLFVGTPGDLPPVVLKLLHDPDLAFRLVISCELAVVAFALITPRLGWPLVCALMLAFLVVLGEMIAAGKTSCGCFGGKIQIRPEVMFGIDLVAFVSLLAVKPWSVAPATGVRLLLLTPALVLAVAAPWIVIPGQDAGDGNGHVVTGSGPQSRGAGSRPAGSGGSQTPPAGGFRRGYVVLKPTEWVGKPLAETQLAKYIPIEKFEGWDRGGSTLVLYRSSCEHCAKHLERLAKDKSGTVYVLVLVPEAPGTKNVIKIKPEVPVEVSLPEDQDFFVDVPYEIVLDADGRVVKVTYAGE
jgi:hypothetical protein